ncbi:hypothetical protein GCM10019016_028600 [Streptomyces prasinosporus]|uniref:Cytochrome c domain-containing protein n=1 Tax=Streptomyces prasinosporus TaxID=68256 RepID=A0ABP6TLV4_9ACTN
MLTGPQNMPSFPDSTMSEQNKKDIIAYLGAVNARHREPGRHVAGRASAPFRGSVRVGSSVSGALIAVAVWVAARTAKAKKS